MTFEEKYKKILMIIDQLKYYARMEYFDQFRDLLIELDILLNEGELKGNFTDSDVP